MFYGEHILFDKEEQQKLEWRTEGSKYEPEDPIMTINDVTQQLDTSEPSDDGGKSVFEMAMNELEKQPFLQQQEFASKYRFLADQFK